MNPIETHEIREKKNTTVSLMLLNKRRRATITTSDHSIVPNTYTHCDILQKEKNKKRRKSRKAIYASINQ